MTGSPGAEVRPAVGLELVNPRTGSITTFRATAESTAWRYVEVDVTYAAGATPPPLHLHPSQQENFTVLSGRMRVECGEDSFEAAEGERFAVPAGTKHRMSPAGAAGAALRWKTAPALRTDLLFCALWQTARDHDWQPDPLDLLGVLGKFGEEFCLG